MKAARKLAPPPPASQTRRRATITELRARAVRLLDRAAVEVRATRDEADALDVRARELDAAADELRWLASLEL